MSGLDFGSRGEGAIDAAGGTLFDVDEEEAGTMLSGERGSVAEGDDILDGVIEGDEDALVAGEVEGG